MSCESLITYLSVANLTLEKLRQEAPSGGLFAGREWLWSPEPFALSKSQKRALLGLGHPLKRFQEVCDQLHRQSSEGKLPTWISKLLDAGKPPWLLRHQLDSRNRGVMPRVIRPDLLLKENGFAASELDGVPGGIGTLAWLSQTYARFGFEIFGGSDGMLRGFSSLFEDGADILISEESSDYLPEMRWVADQLGSRFRTQSAEAWSASDRDVYRFFELFDWESIPAIQNLADLGRVTPPLKPHFEEKLWLALFWSPSLRQTWKSMLRGSHLRRLRDLIPFGWVVDPAELPPQAALPRLEVSSWDEVAQFSQKNRQLVLKVSGFSELAWGSRGVTIGHDVSLEEWSSRLTHAQSEFQRQPWIIQEFQETKLVEHPYFDPSSGQKRVMIGRVRLCPYYFVNQSGQTTLGGCLATIVPSDKKKIHGMRDGILVPCI